MIIFWRELKANAKALFFWSLGMIGLVASGMAKYGAGIYSGTSANAVLDAMPKSLQALFGFTGLDISKVSGFYGVLYPFILLTVAIHAVLLGADIIVKEERDKTSEFLYVKPISRKRILTEKILAAVFNVLVVALATFSSSVIIINKFNTGEQFMTGLVQLMIGMLVLQFVFLSIGFAVAAMLNNPKRAMGVASGIMLFTYFLSLFLAVANHPGWVEIFTPYMYFKPSILLYKAEFPVWSTFVAIVTVVLCTILAYRKIDERDLDV